ncbi:hypothetical protein Q6281_30055, partial [Klebsiella pneumoniae]|nr:hypothetical protein [Klebsiella pneumoniae]
LPAKTVQTLAIGIAEALDGTAITRTDHVVGTRGFLAPEQLTGAPVTFATDLYAFGMVLCHAAVGRRLAAASRTHAGRSAQPA